MNEQRGVVNLLEVVLESVGEKDELSYTLESSVLYSSMFQKLHFPK